MGAFDDHVAVAVAVNDHGHDHVIVHDSVIT
jgi:hypothetical protein